MSTLINRSGSDAVHIRQITERLIAAYIDRYPASHIEAVVASAAQQLASARIRMFVPVFIERMARDTLDRPR